tara:strand:+ start:13626 stop:16031 length:2406 start_codon:yes stop_codon:yes gene_type:complete
MQIDLYQVDAFTDKVFGGNPAAVCPLNEWLPDHIMQNIAAENNLSETAFFVPKGDGFHIRWFTPAAEVDLCGHATLAAAYVIFNHLDYSQEIVRFDSKSGALTVENSSHGLTMDFPAWDVTAVKNHDALVKAMGAKPKALYQGQYWLAEFETEDEVRALAPDFKALQSIDDVNFLIVTAPAQQGGVDFVSRFFCPKYGIDEDPVTGSAHCALTPFWSNRLHKQTLIAHQISERKGLLTCESANDRVRITGKAVLYMHGTLHIRQHDWWRGAAIYQIYPRSFYDTNNDGVGDLPGITKKLNYIADLGMDAIWISPFFPSPMKDFGYDISDYRNIDPVFGTLDDFKTLLSGAHKHGLKIIIDLALSHTSDQHPWFSDPSKKDWYVWADARLDEEGNPFPPNNWASVFGESAWEWDDKHQQYYFHNFLKEQPDLNYHNPEVQEEVLDICRFWLDMGVDGFRLDTVNFYFHDAQLRDNPGRTYGIEFATQLEKPVAYSQQQHIYDKSRPENLDFIARMRALSDRYDSRVLIGEIGDDNPYDCAREYTRGTKHLHTTYNTHMMSGTEKDFTEDLVRIPLETYFRCLGQQTEESDESGKPASYDDVGWPSWAFSNHDVVRVASRWYKLYDHNPDLSKLLMVLLGCLPGTLFMYQGEELGLPEAEIPFDDIQDPWAKQTWPEWQGRDGCRSPMVWHSKKPNHGFSAKKPWLPIPKTHENMDAYTQCDNSASTLKLVKTFYAWRKNKEEFFNLNFEFKDTAHSKIIHIVRRHHQNETHCIFNISSQELCYLDHTLQPYSFSTTGFTCES